MNTEVYNTLLEALRADYKSFVDKFDKVSEENPDMDFEEVNALVVHEPEEEMSEEAVRLSKDYPLEYATAADAVYMEAVLEAMAEDARAQLEEVK